MGSRIRFTKAAQVFEAFAELHEDVQPAEGDVSPQDHTLALLEGDDPHTAITFFAYILPKPEAVWWGLKCVEGLDTNKSEHDRKVLDLCANWVREGDEEARLAVLPETEDFNNNSPSVWIGRAVAWSGGSLSPNPDFRVDVPPALTAKGVNAAVQLAIANQDRAGRGEAPKLCIRSGLSFAEGGVMPVVSVTKQAVT
ncbi:hypothetical protein ABVF61_23980 [Roseibium sp. HPY-6]|uniref:DUF6931 family protein n=1 Tax=Roseibium sp. HPY-6 TaxID=3229852 RepID=UPI00338FE227